MTAKPEGNLVIATTHTYLVECYWPGVREAKFVEAIDRAAQDPAAKCLDSILIPTDEIVLCLFDAPSERAVRDATRRARLPSERVVECVQLVPSSISPEPRGPRS
jgi:hypothetical protein